MEKVNYLSRDKFKSKWESTNLTFERDLACGFSWPQKNYRCSFCKKEFRSAQALGGHMNVHRRDRAKLRQSPSWDFPNPSPSPNPNPNFSSSSSFFPHMSTHYTSLTPSLASFSSPSSTTTNDQRVPLLSKNMGAFLDQVGGFKGSIQEKEPRVCKKKEFLGLDLDMGVHEDSKEDLDLELRLGYS